MGHTPIVDPRLLSLEARIRPLERAVDRRRSRLWRLGWKRRSAYRACVLLIEIREHVLYGWHDLRHLGSCCRGSGVCGIKAPEPQTYAERLRDPRYVYLGPGQMVGPRDPGKSRTL